jgi:protein-disulfide isomerase-like protein with CxxC motif
MKRLGITVFADPVCTWCWGSAPILRAIEYRLAEQVEIEYVMSGMIEDIRTFINRRLQIGGDIALSNRNMQKAWVEASVTHGMPVTEHNIRLFSEEHRSTYPQNMAYITAKLCCGDFTDNDLSRANRFLRRLQEATAVEGLQTSHIDVISDIAAVEGYSPEDFRQTLNSDAVKKAFAADRERAAIYEVKSLPTILLEYEGRESILRGYTPFEQVMEEIIKLTGGKISSKNCDHCTPTIDNVKKFVQHYRSVYPVEIATVFGLKRKSGRSALNIESYEQLPDIIDELLKSKEIGMTPTGNSFKIFDLKEKPGISQERMHELHHSW